MSDTESLTRIPVDVSRGKNSTVSEEKRMVAPADVQPASGPDDATTASVPAAHTRDTGVSQRLSSQILNVCQHDPPEQPSALTFPASSSTQNHDVAGAPLLASPSSSTPDSLTKTALRPDYSPSVSRPQTSQSLTPKKRDHKSTSRQQPLTSVTPKAGVASQILDTVISQKVPPVKAGYMDFSAKVIPFAEANKYPSVCTPTSEGQVSACKHIDHSGALPLKHSHSEERLTLTTDTILPKKTLSLTESLITDQKLSLAPRRSPSPTSIWNQEDTLRSFDTTPSARAAAKRIVSLESAQSDLSIGSVDIGFFSPKRSVISDYMPQQETVQHADLPGPPGLPWATIFVIGLQLMAHWKFLLEQCPKRRTSVATILQEGRWERLALAAFHHDDVVHITSNVVSFLFKGLVLEVALGTMHFAHVFAIVVFLVGIVNAAIVQYLHVITGVASPEEMDLNTFAGVAVALELLHRKRFPNVTADFMLFEIGARPVLLVMCEMTILWACSSKNLLPVISGLIVGFILAETSVGGFIVRAPPPRHQLQLRAIPRTPVTCLLVACICATHLCGQFPETFTAEKPNWILAGPLRQPSLSGALYVGNVYHVAYIVFSLLAVGHSLERTLGSCRFAGLVVGLLFSMSVFDDVLSFVNWKSLVAIWSNSARPATMVHTGDCGCAMVGTILALKAIHHTWEPRSGYLMASFPINVSFWPGLLLELAHLHMNMHDGASFCHVTGAFLGLTTAHLWRRHLLGIDTLPAVASSASSLGPYSGFERTPKDAPHAHCN